MSRELQKLAKDLKPFMARWIEGGAGGSAGAAGGAPSPHELEGIHHTGTLNFNTVNEVNISAAADGDTLYYDGTALEWKNTEVLAVRPGVDIVIAGGEEALYIEASETLINPSVTNAPGLVHALGVGVAGTSQPAVAGDGAILSFRVADDNLGAGYFADLVGVVVDPTPASKDGYLMARVMVANTLTEIQRWEGSGVTITGTAAITGVTTITGIADGGLTSYDLKVGDTTTPDYGMIQVGNFAFGRTSYVVGAIDLDGAILFRNIGGPVTSEIEFIFTESVGNTARFALPKSGVGNATYNARSMLIAGPAPADTDFVKVSYWQTQGIFHNLVCDTSATGADFGVQNDLEVEGDIFVDSMKESTTAAGITFDNTVIHSNIATGTAPFTISSTTKVANLNVDSLDDQSGAYYLDSVNFTGTDWVDLTDSGVTTLHTHSGLPPGPHGLGSHDDVTITAVADNEVLAYDSGTTDWINQTAAEAGLSATGHTHTHASITSVSSDQHHAQVHAIVGADHSASGLTVGYVIRASGATMFAWAQLLHADLGTVTSDQHHAQAHTLSGGDHTGDLAYTQLDSLVDTTGGGSASLISGAQHVHTGADGSSQVTYSDLLSIPSTFPPASHDLDSHSDVVISGTPADNELLAWNTGTSRWINQTAAEAALATASHTHAHGDLTSVTSDQHHPQAHALSGGDHTGDLAYSQLDSLVDTTGGGSASLISGAQHVHTGADGSSAVSHSNLSSVTSDQHHAQTHALSGGDHTGDLVYSQLDAIVDTTGGGSASLISAAVHAHTGADGSSQIDSANFTGTDWTDLTDAGATTLHTHTGLAPGPHSLGSHDDVVITAVADNEVLAYHSATGDWINQTAAEAGLSASGHTHDHGTLTGLGDDDHSAVYPGYGQTETISGAWTYSNGLTLANDKWLIGDKAVSGTVNLISVNTSDAVIVGATGVDTTIWGADVDIYGAEDLINIGLTSVNGTDKLISIVESIDLGASVTRWMYAELFQSTTDGYFQIKWADNSPQTVHIARFGISEIVFNEDSSDIDVRFESDNSTHAFFLDSSTGYVGFGGVPTDDFQVIVEGDHANMDLLAYQTRPGAIFTSWTGYLAGGTAASPTKTLSGDSLFLGSRGYQETTSDWTLTRAYLALVATEDYTSTAQGMRMDFVTVVTGGTTRTVKMTLLDGLQIGTPTGGDKGAGTINASGDIYKNDTAYANPDYVLEHYYRGSISEFADNPGAAGYGGLDALDVTAEFMELNLHLPWIQHDRSSGIFDRGDMLLVGQESMMLYIVELEERVRMLEANQIV